MEDRNARPVSHQGTGQILSLDLGNLVIEGDKMDLPNRSIDLSKVSMQNTFVSFHQMAGFQGDVSSNDTVASEASGDVWHIGLAELDLDNNSIQFHDFDKPFMRNQFDGNHVWITNLTTKANGLEWSGNEAKAELESFSFRDHSGFAIESFSAGIMLSDTAAQVRDFQLISTNSKIDLSASAKFASLKTISDSYHDAVIELDINESAIGVDDIRFFAASMLDSLPVNIPQDMTISLDAQAKGALTNFAIKHLRVSTLSETVLDGGGIIRLVDGEQPAMDLILKKFYTTKKDIGTLLPDTLIPSSIALPDWINVSGTMKGTVQSPAVNTIVTSSMGRIDLIADLHQSETTGKSRYKGSLDVKEFQTGKLLKKRQSLWPNNTFSKRRRFRTDDGRHKYEG